MRSPYQKIVQSLSEITPQKWIDDDIWRLHNFYYGLHAETGSFFGPGLVMGGKSGLLALKWAIDYPDAPVFVVETDPLLRKALETSAHKLSVNNIIICGTVINFLNEIRSDFHRLDRVWVDWAYYSGNILEQIAKNFRIGYLAGEFDEFQSNPLWLHRFSRTFSKIYYWNNLTHGSVMSGQMSGSTDVSVIVYPPSSPKQFNDCLSSIVSQTLNQIEILVPLSSDQIDLLDVVQDWEKRDCRVRALYPEIEDLGLSHATPLSAAAGLFISFIDGNDVIDPCMLQALTESAIKFTSDIAQCGFRERNISNGAINQYLEYIKFNQSTYEGSGLVNDPKSLISSRPTVWRRIFRRQFLIDHDVGIPKNFQVSGSLYYNFITLALADRVSAVGSCHYYRQAYVLEANSDSHILIFQEVHLLKRFVRQHHSRILEERLISVQVATYSRVLSKIDRQYYDSYCMAVKYDLFEDTISLPCAEVMKFIEIDSPNLLEWASSVFEKHGSGIDAWALLLDGSSTNASS
jgi:glycosyltransferase involved in cell wall biosynthesis